MLQFGIGSGTNLADSNNKICYCLKSGINKHFLSRMVEGQLDEEISGTVLIVDEARAPTPICSHSHYPTRPYLVLPTACLRAHACDITCAPSES